MARSGTIGQYLHDRSKIAPESVAILASGQTPMRYKELATLAEQIRVTLHSTGINGGDRVATAILNGPELAALFFSITGHTSLVPLNPTYTYAEFRILLADVGAKAIVVDSNDDSPAREAANDLDLSVIELEAELNKPAGTFRLTGPRAKTMQRARQPEAGDVALVLHTSGTTSRPKRVPLTHANLVASASNFRDWYALVPRDRTLSVMPYYHIQGVIGGILAPLISGGSMVCARGFDGDSFFALLNEFQANWYTAGPTYHQAIVARADRHRDIIKHNPLRFIRSSSAPLAPQTMLELERVFDAPVLEGYGLTETCLHSLSNPLPPGQRKPGAVGLSAGTEVSVMDEEGSMVAPGDSGEVVLRGATVMAGYEDNPEANDAVFEGDWFRTGDQGHFDEDGYLVLTGRYKELINRGGEKIAPVEIDHVLLDHPDIAQAVAFAVPHPTLGEEVGAAIVCRDGAEVSEANIRTFAANALAAFKVPRHVVFVDAIPKSTVGKSQRIGLAEMLNFNLADDTPAAGQQPLAPTENAIVEIWKTVLRRDAISVDDDFFQLGGDSLQAIHVLADIEQRFGIYLPSEILFDEAATVARLAQRIERLSQEPTATARSRPKAESRESPLPASFAQQSFWVGSRLFRDQPIYNVVGARRLSGPLDLEVFAWSLNSIVERHEILRTRFVYDAGQLLLVPFAAEPVSPEIFDASDFAGDDVEARTLAWVRQESQRPFDVVEGPLWRMCLLPLGETDHVLLVVLHHAIVDGWGCEILIEDIFAAYNDYCVAGALLLKSLAVQFADFAAWQRRCWDNGEFNTELAYWRETLAELPAVLQLPTDQPRPEWPDWQGRKALMVLPKALTSALEDVGRRQQATLFMTLLAAFDIFIHAQSGETDIVVGVPAANRSTLEVERVVGCFMNPLPYRTDLRDNPTFTEILKRVRDTAADAYAHQNIPLEILIKQLLPNKGFGQDAFFSVLFQLRGYQKNEIDASGDLSVAPFDVDPGITPVELAVDWVAHDAELVCRFNYRTDLFADATIFRWMEHYRTILETVAADPKSRLSEL